MVLKGILWDLDGVLVDTDLARVREQTNFLQSCGFSEEEVKTIIPAWERLFWYFDETKYTRILKILQNEFHCEDKLTDEKITSAQTYLSSADSHEIEFTAHAEEVLQECLNRNIPMGIVSNGDNEYQWSKIYQVGLEKYFPIKEAIIIDNTLTGKPRPDGILTACDVLEIKPSATLFIGDRLTDTLAANLAGCININYIQHVPDAKEPPKPNIFEIEKPYMNIHSLEEIIPLLE